VSLIARPDHFVVVFAALGRPTVNVNQNTHAMSFTTSQLEMVSTDLRPYCSGHTTFRSFFKEVTMFSTLRCRERNA